MLHRPGSDYLFSGPARMNSERGYCFCRMTVRVAVPSRARLVGPDVFHRLCVARFGSVDRYLIEGGGRAPVGDGLDAEVEVCSWAV